MKTKLNTGSRSLGKLSAVIAATLMLSGVATVSRGAAFDSPTGLTWDFVMSGARNGLAYLTFNVDGTITGVEVLVPRKKGTPSLNDRGGFEPDERTPEESSSSTNSIDQVFGAGSISSGQWSFDTSGKVVGFFAEGTNGASVGFKATVTQGAKMTMVASIGAGKVNYRGRPAVLLLGNYAGPWNGLKQQNDQSFVEIFNMTLTGAQGPNQYSVAGNGAGYTYSGIAIISVQKKIAFGLDVVPTGTTRATFGDFNLSKAKATTQGWDQLDGPPGAKAKFKVEQQPPP